jgi:predicted transcriptional regulator
MEDRSRPGPAQEVDCAAPEIGSGESRRDWLRAAVKQGIEDIEAGRVVDLESAFGRIEAMLDELEAGKRDSSG